MRLLRLGDRGILPLVKLTVLRSRRWKECTATAKLSNVRERVHQPFRDSLVRTAGLTAGVVQDNTNLFTINGKDAGQSNLPQGSVLPSDQSMVVLALRVFTWFRNPIARGALVPVSGGTTYPTNNGDFAFAGTAETLNAQQSQVTNGNAPGSIEDVYRLYWQSNEQLFWSFGAGDKYSITSMPTSYFPAGGGLHGDLGAASDIISLNNGMPDHQGILRLARAILIPPRQNIKCAAQIVALPDGSQSGTFATTQNARNMLSLTSNLNAPDLVQKVINFTFDGLFSRDVQ